MRDLDESQIAHTESGNEWKALRLGSILGTRLSGISTPVPRRYIVDRENTPVKRTRGGGHVERIFVVTWKKRLTK